MIYIIDYGINNINSITRILHYLNVNHKVVNKHCNLDKCSSIILPGIGNFARGIKSLKKEGLDEMILKSSIINKRPLLGICLGMHLITAFSEEGTSAGLNLIEGNVKRISTSKLRTPHIGWNYAYNDSHKKKYYFMHNYYIDNIKEEYIWLKSMYHKEFISAVKKDNIFGVQFHPEKSGNNGLDFFKDYLEKIK